MDARDNSVFTGMTTRVYILLQIVEITYHQLFCQSSIHLRQRLIPKQTKKQQEQQQQKLSSLLSPVMNASIVCFETRHPLAADGLGA